MMSRVFWVNPANLYAKLTLEEIGGRMIGFVDAEGATPWNS